MFNQVFFKHLLPLLTLMLTIISIFVEAILKKCDLYLIRMLYYIPLYRM